jgi:hypothetical protein
MINAEDRDIVLKALREGLISPDQVLVCLWDIETAPRTATWERTLPMRLMTCGYLRGQDLQRLRASVSARSVGAPPQAPPPDTATATALATPPAGLPAVRLPAPPAGPRPSHLDHAVAAYLQQFRLVPPAAIRRAFRIQSDYAPFGISMSLVPILRRLGLLNDRLLAELQGTDFALLTAPAEWRTQAVPGWAILGKLATGGSATVFQAKPAFTGGLVALKILQHRLWGLREEVRRFEQEGALLTSIKHPNLVQGLGSGISPMGLPYTVLGLIRGEPVDRILENGGPLPAPLALSIVRQAATALSAIHAAGFVHGDVKPENLLLSEGQHVTLCDLHLARPIGGAGTLAATTAGTAAYMSPEQARGATDLRPASDLYALGLTFYAMLTGRCPFEGKDAATVFEGRFLNGHGAPDLATLSAPPAVLGLLGRMLHPDRNRRQADEEELMRAIASTAA